MKNSNPKSLIFNRFLKITYAAYHKCYFSVRFTRPKSFFNVQKTLLLYLIIYTAFSTLVFGQNLLLKVEGSTTLETSIIDSLHYKKFHGNYASIKQEIDSVQKAFYKLGYIENELKAVYRLNDSVFSAKLILKKKYNTIQIYFDESLVDSKIINMVSNKVFDRYFILELNKVETALNLINSKIAEKGFPFAKLQLSNITINEASQLLAHLMVRESEQKRTIDHIVIKGYERFPHTFLKHYLKIKPGQTFNLNTIKNKTEQLQNLKFASETKSPEVLFSKDSTTLYLYLQKTKSNAFDGFLGFGTTEDNTKLQFNGYLNLSLNNNLNYGESFKLLYRNDESEQKTFETNLSLPYLLKTPVGLDMALRIFKRDSSFTTVNQLAKLHYQINPQHKIYTGITSTQSNNLLSAVSVSNISDYKTTFYSIAYGFLKTQSSNMLFPVNSQAYVESNFGNRSQENEQESQSYFIVDGYKIFNLDLKNSIYVRAHGEVLNSNTYFENELLRFGGIHSIRGFEENSIYASLYSVINTEYRYQLNNAIYLHSITDIGYFENKTINTKEKLYGFGLGFGILTKSGLLKLNYANGNIENSKFKLSNSKIHLSLMANF